MKRPLLLAHRGFSGNYPENSPLAFRMAVEKTAADGFESDVHITKDGKLVIFHSFGCFLLSAHIMNLINKSTIGSLIRS